MLLYFTDATSLISKTFCWIISEKEQFVLLILQSTNIYYYAINIYHDKRRKTLICKSIIYTIYLQSFLMSAIALRVMDLGNSIASIPFKIILYVFIGSAPVKGGVPVSNSNMRTPRDQ